MYKYYFTNLKTINQHFTHGKQFQEWHISISLSRELWAQCYFFSHVSSRRMNTVNKEKKVPYGVFGCVIHIFALVLVPHSSSTVSLLPLLQQYKKFPSSYNTGIVQDTNRRYIFLASFARNANNIHAHINENGKHSYVVHICKHLWLVHVLL